MLFSEFFIMMFKLFLVLVNIISLRWYIFGMYFFLIVVFGMVEQVNIFSFLRMIGSFFSLKGFFIEVLDEIVVYGFNKEFFFNDVFFGILCDVIGSEYYVIVYFFLFFSLGILVVGVLNVILL